MAVAEGAEPVSLKKRDETKGVSPWLDAWRLFRRNKAAVVALGVIAVVLFIAASAALWTSVGLLDARTGVKARHTINPVNQAQVDAYPDPMTCARDEMDANPYWC